MTPTEKNARKHHCPTCHVEAEAPCIRIEPAQKGNSHRARRRLGRSRSEVLHVRERCTCPDIDKAAGLA